ncbi:translation initiation factor IF-2 [Lacibacter sediminis]|uniref:Translation initiation factor IF-2 n=1 Tax=Lacibacter sediminis TaxID=2760713 RepID=A0A7G5XFD8_9BACT|nr:translation initiation factor IF-2 [Lacibacter sediminis]QNA44191.1 translation initiation factor IF-2 [Lacibacter sediminis]
MSESNTPRLMAAAKEFNIGKDTLIDFLANKGFNKDDLKPTAKLTEGMYRALQAEFSSDKLAKAKSDQIEIPKGGMSDLKKKKEEEDISIRKEVKKVVKEEPKVEEVKPVEAPVVVEQPPVVVVAEVPKVEEIVQPQPEPEVTKVEAPEVEGPKIITKIDLDKIDSSTRPKKIEKKKKEEPKEEVVVPEVKEEVVAPVAVAVTEEPVAEEDEEVVIENIKADKLEGPKILGKIELPVNSDTRPKPVITDKDKEKRKRKRIPIDKKGSQPPQGGGQQQGQGGQQGGGFQNRGGQQQGGGQRREGGSRIGPPQRAGSRPAITRREDKVIDAKEIQEKLRETQAKLSGQGGRGKSLKAKYRKLKRDEMADNMPEGGEDNKLQVTEFISAAELASLMDVSATDVVAKCFSLGMMVSINQRLDAELIELVAGEFGFEVEFIDMEKQAEMEEEEEDDDVDSLQPRAPIVTIMGHVDHGKTSLLDYIRNANVVSGEAGGITQHIGAYEVTNAAGKKITFLDTPGHEAFTAMRARGAKVTDVAVIVVAADDAVMPQTKEAISHAQAAGVPMIFAVNKIDKDGANPQKIYEQLSQMNILVEEWGGKFQSQELSAKKGLNVDKLLEKILLEAELLELKANPEREGTGSIIEASLDKGRGYVATILVQNGTLKQGDLIVSGQYYGRIKAMFNERNQRIDKAGPSTPVQILGLNGAPQAGEKFKVYEDEAEAKEIAGRRAQILREQGIRTKKHITLDEIGRRLALGNFKELNLIIKGDVDGSVEALTDSLQKLSTEEIAVNVVHKAVGQISEADVTLASASDAILIGFNVRPSLQASRLAEQEGVEIKNYSIIYNAIEEVKSAMEGLLEPKITEKEVATVEIREVYKFDKATVAGCYVLDGKMKRDAKIRLFRDGVLVYPRTEGGFAELGSLKRFKDDAKEVASNMECGLTIKNFADLNVGDTIVAFEEEEVKRTL